MNKECIYNYIFIDHQNCFLTSVDHYFNSNLDFTDEEAEKMMLDEGMDAKISGTDIHDLLNILKNKGYIANISPNKYLGLQTVIHGIAGNNWE